MSNEFQFDSIRRRDEILRETLDLSSELVQSLQQQQKFASDTRLNLDHQNAILSEANRKIRLMNEDLNSVVNEINEIEARQGCFCCQLKRKRGRKLIRNNLSNSMNNLAEKKDKEQNKTISNIPPLIENDEKEKRIVEQLNEMKRQILVFHDQIQTINQSFEQGDEIIEQLSDRTDQYINAITVALSQAEQVLGRKFPVQST